MNSNKENMEFFLPTLVNNDKFSQLFYHQNKLIVYNSTESNNNFLLSPKAIEMLQRPKTSASSCNKLSGRLAEARSKASIQKFILTHKRINQERKKMQTNYFPKKRFNRSTFKKTQISKLQTVITEQSSVHRDKLTILENGKQNKVKKEHSQVSLKNISLEPSQKLIRQITEKSQSQVSDRKSVRVSIRDIKSVDRNSSRRDINELDQNTVIPLSESRKRTDVNYKTSYPNASKKLNITNQKDFLKANKSNLSSFSNVSSKPKSKKAVSKQPQINHQSSDKSETELQKNTSNESDYFCNLFSPICAFYGPKDSYKKNRTFDWLQEIQIPTNFGVLPQECFFSSETEKRKSYIDNRINHLQMKIHEQEGIINDKTEEIQKLLSQKQQVNKNSGADQNSSVKSTQQNVSQEPNIITNHNHNRLSSISEEENDQRPNQNDPDEDEIQKALKEQIESLNNRTTIEHKNLLENYSNYTVTNNEKDSFMNGSRFLGTKINEPKKVVLTSRLRDKEHFLEIQEKSLKRAQIVKFLNRDYYSEVEGLYWVLINQKENAYFSKKRDHKQNSSGANKQESMKYIKEYNKSRSQIIQQSETELEENRNQEKIYVDKEFPHQSIQIPNLNEQIHWLYFKPCSQSSIFPSDLKLPQHYIVSQSQSPSITSLVSLLNCILNLNPTFIERIFEPTYNNVFACWLNKDNRFEPVHVDGYMPYNGKLNSLLAWSEEFLWIAILMKCCAKLFGGYDQLLKLNFDSWSQVILGKTLLRLKKPSYEEIKQWQEEEFEQKIIEYFAKAQQKHKSSLVVRNRSTKGLYLITGIKKNKIKLSHIHTETKRLQISLFEFIIDETYELIFFPESSVCHHATSQYQSFEKGNIITYQLKVAENKSSITICSQLSSEERMKSSFNKAKDQTHERRRILVYEIPYTGKRENKRKHEMILKYSSDTHPYSKMFTNSQGIETLQMDIPQIKKGEYKIFIQCGKIKLNDYFESQYKTISKKANKWDEFHQKREPINLEGPQIHNRKFTNVFSIVSSCPVELRGGKSLIVGEQMQQHEVIEDENYVYNRQGKMVEEEDET